MCPPSGGIALTSDFPIIPERFLYWLPTTALFVTLAMMIFSLSLLVDFTHPEHWLQSHVMYGVLTIMLLAVSLNSFETVVLNVWFTCPIKSAHWER